MTPPGGWARQAVFPTGGPAEVTPRLSVLAAFAALSLSACGSSEPNLMTYAGSREGPDEFLVVPAKPLETPPKPGELPPPAPGGTNRADPTPEADAVAALGGKPQALNQTGYTQSDATLVAYADRYGVDPAIRAKLAEEDLKIRQRNDGLILERMFNVNLYYQAYANQSLNQQQELERFRNAGIPTSSAPPVQLKPE